MTAQVAIIAHIMGDLSKHPGFLGLTSQGIIAIHADWPTYPMECGPGVALDSLGAFPRGTRLRPIDDIDQCVLLLAGGSARDPFSEQNFHAAVWHEDLIALGKSGYIDGVRAVSEYEWRSRRYDEAGGGKPLYYKDGAGRLIEIPRPRAEDYESDDESDDFDPAPRQTFVAIVDGGIEVTERGWAWLDDESQRAGPHLHPALLDLVQPLVDIEKYDSAVRDGSVLLETRLRSLVGSRQIGWKLVDELIQRMTSSDKFVMSQVKTLRGELRPFFKFVRNEFAHNLPVLTRSQCYSLLRRLSLLLSTVDSIRL